MNIVINRMKELESEVARLKKENEALSLNYKTLEDIATTSLTEKSRENEVLKKTIKQLEYGSETAHRMLGEAFDDYRDLKEQLKRSDELVQYYINELCKANEKLETVKDYVNKAI